MILETIVIDDDEIFLLISKKIIDRSKFHPTPKIFVESIKALDFFNSRLQSSKGICHSY